MTGTSGFTRKPRDLYPTIDEDVTQVFLDTFIPDGLKARLWECAAGEGHMTRVLERNGHDVVSTDIVPLFEDATQFDFLGDEDPPGRFDGIITNPPYGDLAESFCQRIVTHVRTGRAKWGALMMRHEYDCASTRDYLFLGCPEFMGKLTMLWRPRWIADSTGSPRHVYAWYAWGKPTGRAPSLLYSHRP